MHRPRDRTIELSTGKWEIKFIRRGHPKAKGAYGLCDWNTKTIWIRYDVSRLRVIDTLLHEIIHASNEILYEAESLVSDLATVGAKTVLEILDETHGYGSATRGHKAS